MILCSCGMKLSCNHMKWQRDAYVSHYLNYLLWISNTDILENIDIKVCLPTILRFVYKRHLNHCNSSKRESCEWFCVVVAWNSVASIWSTHKRNIGHFLNYSLESQIMLAVINKYLEVCFPLTLESLQLEKEWDSYG